MDTVDSHGRTAERPHRGLNPLLGSPSRTVPISVNNWPPADDYRKWEPTTSAIESNDLTSVTSVKIAMWGAIAFTTLRISSSRPTPP